MKAGAVALFVTFLVGLLAGIHSGGEPKVEYRVLHDTETIVETETIEVPTTPEACNDLVRYARTIAKSAGRLESSSAAMLDIMSQLRIIVAQGDGNAANDLETELRALDGTTVGAVETLGEINPYFEEAASACQEASE